MFFKILKGFHGTAQHDYTTSLFSRWFFRFLLQSRKAKKTSMNIKSPDNCRTKTEATVINSDGCKIEMMWINNAKQINLHVLFRMKNIFSHHSFVLGAFIQLDKIRHENKTKNSNLESEWKRSGEKRSCFPSWYMKVIEHTSSFIIIL